MAIAGLKTLKINNPKLSTVDVKGVKLMTSTFTGAPGIYGGMSLH